MPSEIAFPDDTLLVFLGRSDDAAAEAAAVKSLEPKLQEELRGRKEVMDSPPFSEVKIWEWNQDAGSRAGGQEELIAPVLQRANMAIFVFKERIGEITWEELSEVRSRENSPPILALFPRHPPAEGMSNPKKVAAWLDLLERKRSLSAGWGEPDSQAVRPLEEYEDLDHLVEIVAKQFDRDLGTVLKSAGAGTGAGARTAGGTSTAPSALWPPEFPGSVERAEFSEALDNALERGPIVAVEGLSGCGKSVATALYLKSPRARERYEHVFWVDPRPGQNLEDLFAVLLGELSRVRLTGRSLHDQSKQLLDFLKRERALLVVDDFQGLDQPSLAPLFKFARRGGEPARLLTISQVEVESEETLTGIRHVKLEGLNLEEARRIAAGLDLGDLADEELATVLDKTGGLPLALSVLSVLVGRYEMSDLLGGKVETHRRLKGWHKKLVDSLETPDYRLLQRLSMSAGSFDSASAEVLARDLEQEDGAETLDRLERSFLVQRHRDDEWKVHYLVAEFARGELSEDERERSHLLLAEHQIEGVKLGWNESLSDRRFLVLEQACEHFHAANRLEEAGLVLRTISATAKNRGFYGKLKRLAKIQIETNEARTRWTDYDYAHCCLITGNPAETVAVVEPLLEDLEQHEADLGLQLSRLYAEAKAALGEAAEGLEVLEKALEITEGNKLEVRLQAEISRIGLLTELKRYPQAEELCEEAVATAEERGDNRGLAVALTWWGVIDYSRDRFEGAKEKLERSTRLFRNWISPDGERSDRRGTAWSLSYYSACQLRLGEEAAASDNLLRALKIKREIGELSMSYLRQIESFLKLPYPEEVHARLREERARHLESQTVQAAG